MKQIVFFLSLVLVLTAGCSRDEPNASAHEDHALHGDSAPVEGDQIVPSASSGMMPPDYAEVTIAADRQQLLGIKIAKVEQEQLTGTVRASGIVQADETREIHIHTKLMGWVEELYVNTVGQTVKKGDPLYSLYSQELYATQTEYLNSVRTGSSLTADARRRLQLWDVPEDQIRLIERNGARKAILFRAPIGGTVIEKTVLQGHFIEANMMLYHIADLSQVWVLADVYEYEMSRINLGGEAKVLIQGQEEPQVAKIDYVYPTVDQTTRTTKVRLILPNPNGTLRPGNYAVVDLATRPTNALWIPQDAVVDTGVRQIVYLALEGGRFRPVEVSLGRRIEGRVEVRGGLDEGVQVAAGALFLLDSESQLRGVSGPGARHGGH